LSYNLFAFAAAFYGANADEVIAGQRRIRIRGRKIQQLRRSIGIRPANADDQRGRRLVFFRIAAVFCRHNRNGKKVYQTISISKQSSNPDDDAGTNAAAETAVCAAFAAFAAAVRRFTAAIGNRNEPAAADADDRPYANADRFADADRYRCRTETDLQQQPAKTAAVSVADENDTDARR
jgi:hypothetical protein